MEYREDDVERGLIKRKKKKAPTKTRRYVALVVVGILTAIYSFAEMGIAIWIHSIALLSDGIHNLSDVISLVIAGWALMKSTSRQKEKMTYGWRRTEILGAVINGSFLISLSAYIIIEAIPRLSEPQTIPDQYLWWFIGVAACGLGVNTLGTILFCLLSGGHGHVHAGGGGGHGHSHDGGHDHDKKKKPKQPKQQIQHESFDPTRDSYDHSLKNTIIHDDDMESHGHAHKEKKEKHGHGHDQPKEKKEKHGHAHSEKKEKHGHAHAEKKEKHGHAHAEKKEKHGHAHADKHGHDHDDHDDHDDHGGHQEREKRDHNIHAVFLHYLGDALSSVLVLTAGLLLKFIPKDQTWTQYLDPVSSLLIVALIMWTTIPLLIGCSQILLQQTPEHLKLDSLKKKLASIKGIHGVHDLHVWQLVDDMTIATLHVKLYNSEAINFAAISAEVKKIFHKYGIHSSTLQPEFVPDDKSLATLGCEQNCVQGCEEDWCCKTEDAEVLQMVDYVTFTPPESVEDSY